MNNLQQTQELHILTDARQRGNEPTHLLWTQEIMAPYAGTLVASYWVLLGCTVAYVVFRHILAPLVRQKR